MNKKKIIGLLVITIIVLFSVFSIVLVISQINEKNNKEEICKKVYDKLQIIINGDTLEANMNFIDNYENKEINKMYTNISKDELKQNGYMEYIQDTDYMLAFYKKIVINNIEFIRETEDIVQISVNVKRPNLLKIMNECDSENADNENYDFNKTFIDKINQNDFDYEEGSYNITVHKIDTDIKFEYNDNFVDMLYSEKE